MTVKTYSIDQEVAEKFKEKTPSQETSAVLEQLMRDYIGETKDEEIQLDLTKKNLSNSQERLLNLLIEKNVNGRSTNAVFNLCKGKDIYKRSHHFGEGLGSLIKDDEIPYKKENDQIVAEKVECNCGNRFSFSGFIKTDMICPNCDKKAIRVE